MNMRKKGGAYGGHDDSEEDEAKMGFIFQINEHGFRTQLHEEKRQKKGPNLIDYLPLSSSIFITLYNFFHFLNLTRT